MDLRGLGVVLSLDSLEPLVGAVHGRIGETRMTLTKMTAIEPGAIRHDVAWMPMAGFVVPLGQGTAINLARRNTDLGVVHRDGLNGDM